MTDGVPIRIVNADLLTLLRGLPPELADEQIHWVDHHATWAAGVVYEQDGWYVARLPDVDSIPTDCPNGAFPAHAVAVAGMVGHILKGDRPRWCALDLGNMRVSGGVGAPSSG